jgi:hypothetical protein
MRSVLQDWVMELPLMQQATLITGTRGPDGVRKSGPHKQATRYLRYLTLNPAHTDHENNPTDTFMSPNLDSIGSHLADLTDSHDEFPVHWVLHLVHAYQILGHKCPHHGHRQTCRRFYELMCHEFHFNPETEEQMDARLCD